MKRLRTLLPFALLLVAAAVIVNLSVRRDERGDARAGNESAAIPVYVAEQATWVRYGPDGHPQLRAEAASINYYTDRAMQLDTVMLDRLGGDQGAWHLRAARGDVPAGSTRMRLSPEVAVTGTAKDALPVQIAASEVWVDWQQREISSVQPVTLTAPNRRLRADRWQTDFNASRSQLSGHVEVFYDAPSQP